MHKPEQGNKRFIKFQEDKNWKARREEAMKGTFLLHYTTTVIQLHFSLPISKDFNKAGHENKGLDQSRKHSDWR